MQYRDVWSVNLGRWGGVNVRLHMFFALFAAFTFYLAWLEADRTHQLRPTAILCIGVLFVSVLIHELGHYVCATRLGGFVDSIVLGPLGGLRPVHIPKDPQCELVATLAGPLANLMCCMLCLGSLVLAGEPNLYGLLNPLSPEQLVNPLDVWSMNTVMRMGCWINWVLVLVNLIPAFPFDGARASQAFLRTIRPATEARQAVAQVAVFAKLVSIGLLILAWFYRDAISGHSVPPWLTLVLISIFVFFGTRVEENNQTSEDDDDTLFGYDFSQGFTSLERDKTAEKAKQPGPVARWVNDYRRKQAAKKRKEEDLEDRRLDEILARLHDEGKNAITPAERSLLKRVSARYRSRHHIQ